MRSILRSAALLLLVLLVACASDAGDRAAPTTPSPAPEDDQRPEDAREPDDPAEAADDAHLEATAPPEPTFQGGVHEVDDATAERMRGVSWRPECPVGLEELRLLELDHWGFDGAVHRGRLIVHADQAEAVVEIFRRIFDARFPIERMEPIEAYDGDDDASMAANNTSAFNCRSIPGTDRISQHAYGLAIDINPVQNPYLPSDGVVMPPAGERYVDRSLDEPGMIHPDGPVVTAFRSAGWHWGGAWSSSTDYHHFSANGR